MDISVENKTTINLDASVKYGLITLFDKNKEEVYLNEALFHAVDLQKGDYKVTITLEKI